jgi:probable H4MPT-linked C1 transfer pathway protein
VGAGERGLLIDIGSTTTDIVPIQDNRPQTVGLNDTERLIAGELVYSGVGRTPVCAVVSSLRWRGQECPIAAEFFATTADAYVVLGEMAESLDATWTADGRPLTREFSRERLARMICADRLQFDERDARDAAEQIRESQLQLLRLSVERVSSHQSHPFECVVMCGAGEFLVQQLLNPTLPAARRVSLMQELSAEVSACAPAHAVAAMASR